MHDDGIVGTTLLNGNGCVCHSPNFDASVSVWVEGPSQLTIGQTGVYNIYLTGGPMVDGGYNVAARFGTLGIADTNSQIIDGELTHTYPLPFVGDTVHWTFNYTALILRVTIQFILLQTVSTGMEYQPQTINGILVQTSLLKSLILFRLN